MDGRNHRDARRKANNTMKVRMRPGSAFAEYQWSEKVRITKDWQEVSKPQAKAMLRLSYKGRPLVEVEEAKGRKAEVEIEPEPSEDAEQEGES